MYHIFVKIYLGGKIERSCITLSRENIEISSITEFTLGLKKKT